MPTLSRSVRVWTKRRLCKAPTLAPPTVSRLIGIEVDDAVSWQALLGALALELAGMAAMMRADSRSDRRQSRLADPPAEALSKHLLPPVGRPRLPGPSRLRARTLLGGSCWRVCVRRPARKLPAARSIRAISSGAASRSRHCPLSIQNHSLNSLPIAASATAFARGAKAARSTASDVKLVA